MGNERKNLINIMILGLDISTSITGATILNDDGDVVVCEHWDLRKYKDFFEKAEVIKSRLLKIKPEYKISSIWIEQSLQSFRTGFSSAKTLSTLARFNGTVSWLCYEMFGYKPNYIGASSARKQCGIKISRGQKAKEIVLNYVLDNEPEFVVEYTKHGNPRPGSYDRADSLIVAKAGFLRWKQKN